MALLVETASKCGALGWIGHCLNYLVPHALAARGGRRSGSLIEARAHTLAHHR